MRIIKDQSGDREWYPLAYHEPPQDIEVETKVIDKNGVSHEKNLVLQGNHWLLPDLSRIVYHTPTHWRFI